MAAMHSNTIDTASSAGPRLALESVSGSSPQFVPGVPAPNLEMALLEPVDEAMAEAGAGVAVETVDEALGAVDGADVAVEPAVEERTFGQKVLLHVCTSSSSKEISKAD